MRVERPISASQKIPSLDGLRTASLALVLLGHLTGTTYYPTNTVTRFLGSFAHLGVQIFFVISGFLITTLLLNEQNRTGRISLSQFYLRRTVRIFPAAFTYITVIAVLMRPGYLGYAYTYTMCYASQAPSVGIGTSLVSERGGTVLPSVAGCAGAGLCVAEEDRVCRTRVGPAGAATLLDGRDARDR